MTHHSDNASVGLSRAAKRRKKKKGVAVPTCNAKSSVLSPTSENMEHKRQETDEQQPLWQAWKSFEDSRLSSHSSRIASFIETLSRPLPLTFRIRLTASAATSSLLQNEINAYNERVPAQLVQSMCSRTTNDSSRTDGSIELEYFQTQCSKQALTDIRFKDILLQYSQNGTVARQELGSMLPVSALQALGCFDVHEGKSSRPLCVLDMCASPGSKTLQALEILAERTQKFHMVANDILPSRLEALKQAVQRSGMPQSLLEKVSFTCQDASKFELCHVTPITKEKQKTDILYFDVILCDVPCSGDGTCRKDPHILPNWKPNIGNLLHSTQLSILQRALQLLRPNGCVAYSTCTMNPVENEAVVAAAIHHYNSTLHLRESQYSVELVECPYFANVQLRDGISSWKVADYQYHSVTKESEDEDVPDAEDDSSTHHLQWFETNEEAVLAEKNHTASHRWAATLWPPTPPSAVQLSKCKRLWPSDQNSGGFFVALIRKIRKHADSS